MSLDKIVSAIHSAAKAINDSQAISIPFLAVKLRKIAAIEPSDQTVIAMTKIVSAMDDNHRTEISRADLTALYHKLYTNGTNLAEYLSEEMGTQQNLMTPKYAAKQEYQPLANPVSHSPLANALASVLDPTIPLKMFSPEMGQKAVQVVGLNLEGWNLQASKLTPTSGNAHFIVVQADYDTPKGLTSILVPVEINKDKALDPTVFMGNSNPQELNHVNLKAYLLEHAGAKLKVQGHQVVDALTSAITKTASASTVDLATIQIHAAKQVQSPFFTDMVVGQKPYDAPTPELATPKMGKFASFAEKFETPLGQANFRFGVDKVNLGRDAIVRTLGSFGLTSPQISISGCTDTSINYAVSLDGGRLSFNVPVKLANNRILNPSILVCNGNAMAFSKSSIQKLAQTKQQDFKAAAVCSPSYDLKTAELVGVVRTAIAEGNFDKAEDAINVLAQKGDTQSYKLALGFLMQGLTMTKTAAAEEPVCSMIVKSSSSQHPICGHTGLPLHKVYQDKYGVCHPNYRRDIPEAEAIAGGMMNAKLFG